MQRFDWGAFWQHWQLSFLAGCLILVARLAQSLAKSPVEPEDPEQLRIWRARRRWLVVAEVAALPSLTLMAAVLTMLANGSPVVALASGLVAGGVGFPFMVSAMRDFVRRRIDMEGPGGGD